MENLKIVEYDSAYAKEVARMWRMSAEGWNGLNGNATEESILAEHAATTNINTYLAVLGGEVLGYCGLSEYTEDEGAMYIAVLNARYDCHGKGIGKALVKKSIERTIELGYPRLDLHTWASNKKSVPLYKRCGFFLEDRDDTTHLMNFIPAVMQTEAVMDYFENTDWYEALKRTIDMNPDGRKENGFDFYEYNWEKDGRKLRMEFERKGRGIRAIETDDYLITLSVENQKLVFGKSYKAFYEIINKTKKPLRISVKGENDKNIRFALERDIDVLDREVIEGEFFVQPIEEEFKNIKTHPAVVSEAIINGKKALFKLGIVPKFPVKIGLLLDDVEIHEGEASKMYIDIESSLREDAVLEFKLAENKNIEVENREFRIDINRNGRKSIEVPFILKKPFIYSEKLSIRSLLKNGESIEFEKNISGIFRGRREAFGGETEDGFIIVYGECLVILNKLDNEIHIKKFDKQFNEIRIRCPRLGKPYSDDFTNRAIENVRWCKEEEAMVLKGDYVSDDYENVKVTLVIKLRNNGIVESYYELENLSEYETSNEIWLKQTILYEMTNAIIPYDDNFIHLSEQAFRDARLFESSRVNENWVFAGEGTKTRSLWWDSDIKGCFGEWPIYFEHDFGKLEGREKRVTKSVYFALETFKTWQELRSFALKKNNPINLATTSDFEVKVNEGNPFIKDNFTVEIIEHKQRPFKGEVTIDFKDNDSSIVNKKFENEILKAKIDYSNMSKNDIDILSVKMDLNFLSFERDIAVFNLKNMDFQSKIVKDKGLEIYSMNNGVIEIKACPEFSSGLYSLNYKEHEWLDNSFPDLDSRTWFNPWFGGIQSVPEDYVFSSRTMQKEKIQAEFVKIKDSFKNEWKGIKTSTLIEHNENFKGLGINEYFLMLPGVPVLYHTVELQQNTGRFIKNLNFITKNFFKLDSDITKNYVSTKNNDGEITRYRVGVEGCQIGVGSSMIYGSESMEDKLQIYTNYEEYKPVCFINFQDTALMMMRKLTIPNGERLFTQPIFYIFTKNHISDKLLRSLRRCQLLGIS